MVLATDIPSLSPTANHFSLHDEINEIIDFYPLHIFNRETFDVETKKETKANGNSNLFLVISALLLVVSMVSFCLVFYLQSLSFPPPNIALKEHSNFLKKIIFCTSGIACLVAGASYGYHAVKLSKPNPINEEERLTNKAHFPGKAHLVYQTVYKIVENKIPTATLHNNLLMDFPLQTIWGQPKRNAMLTLLGDDSHRQALWQDSNVPRGSIYIHKRYYDEILGELKRTLKIYRQHERDNRDKRPLMTALLHREHMNICVLTMESTGYKNTHRISVERGAIRDVSKELIKNWHIWESFRKDLSKNLTSPTNSRHATNKYRDFCDTLWKAHTGDKSKLMGFLSGSDRTAGTFFLSLEAIIESDLVSKDTTIANFKGSA